MNAFSCRPQRTLTRITATALLGILLAPAWALVFAAPAVAQACEVSQYAPPPTGCQRERLMAAGRQRPFVDHFPSAHKSARAAWERQALTKFGERFKSWNNAACPQSECVTSSISGLKRCTLSGYPCVHNPASAAAADADAATGPQLTERELRQMQRWLRRDGFRRVRVRGEWRELEVDGQWGEVTRTAVVL